MSEGAEIDERVDLDEENYMEEMDDDVEEQIDDDAEVCCISSLLYELFHLQVCFLNAL